MMQNYTVEVQYMNGGCVTAKNPKQALLNYLKENNVKVSFLEKVTENTNYSKSQKVAKVCKLGGFREVVNYYIIY